MNYQSWYKKNQNNKHLGMERVEWSMWRSLPLQGWDFKS
jgi:hypothetical protein